MSPPIQARAVCPTSDCTALLPQTDTAIDIVHSILGEQLSRQDITSMGSTVKLLYVWLTAFLKMHDILKAPPAAQYLQPKSHNPTMATSSGSARGKINRIATIKNMSLKASNSFRNTQE
eukprot:1178388-Prorocentrum_minimum.AAC.3